MRRVAIIGAGEIGGALAQRLASRERARQIRLIDPSGAIAAGKALDIRQSGAIDGFDTRLSAADSVEAAVGAAVVVLADGAGRADRALDDGGGFLTLGRIAGLDREAVIVCAGAGHGSLVERGVGELRVPRARLIGSAPLALAAAVRAMAALALDGSPHDVSLSVLGIPPDAVVPWSDATVAGQAIESLLAPHELAALDARVRALWPPGPSALASAAARVVDAILSGSRRRFPCLVCLDGEWGVRGRAASVAVQLGPGGVVRIIEPTMTVQERVRLENALHTR